MLKTIREKIAVLKESLDCILKDYRDRNITNLKLLTMLNFACDDFEVELLKIARKHNIDCFDIKHTVL